MSTAIVNHEVVSEEKWIEARKQLLVKEKEFTRLRDELSRQRRELPWVEVEKLYLFDGPSGKETLADLFDGRSQLVVYHFMFGPEWEEGCARCSLVADNFSSTALHLAQRDVTFLAISRAPLAKIEAFKQRMGWTFKWVSSFGSDFNYDYRVSFTKEEMASGNFNYNYRMNGFPSDEGTGTSAFYKDSANNIFHTYSSYARGGEGMMGVYHFLDIVPKGRDEASFLPDTMAWVRHHDRYEATKSANGQTSQHACCAEHA